MKPIAIAAILVLAATGASWAQGDATAGQQKAAVCKACHSFDEGGGNKMGPALFGVVGRQPGTHESYSYSSAMVAFGKTNPEWTPELLTKFLENPRKEVPGTKMPFGGFQDSQDAANVVAYLETLK